MSKATIEEELELIDELLKFTHDPYGFVLFSFRWGHDELKDFQGPEQWQQDVLIEISDKLKKGHITTTEAIQIAVSSGHGIGKSALVAWIILWGLSTCEDTKGVVTANTETQLKTKTWAELAKWHRLFIASHWFQLTATAIYSVDPAHERTWRLDMIPWSEHKTEAFAGMHNKGKRILIIFDEASAIPDVIWEVTEGALTDENTEILWFAFGNPTRNVGRFHACFNGLRHRWYHTQIDSRKINITNKKQINRWIEDYGDDSDFVRVRVKGEFPRSSDHQFIPSDLVEEARGKHLIESQYSFAPIVLGLDRGWASDDTVLYLRQGLMSRKLARFNKGDDDMIVAGHIARYEDELRADAIFIDFGYGTGIYSAGKQMGRKWVMVQFGANPIDPQYANKRTEIWGLMRDWLRSGGAIPDEQDLITDLIAPEAYEVQKGPKLGKVILESKDDMKARGLDSPDDGDALALTFSFPVQNKSQKQFAQLSRQQGKYDPFKANINQEALVYNPFSPLAGVNQ